MKEHSEMGDWRATDEGRYVIDSIEYVDPAPPPKSTLFDDIEELRMVWRLALQSIRKRTKDDEARIIEAVREQSQNLHGFQEKAS